MIYTYECPKCGLKTEKQSSVKNRDNQSCDVCNTPLVRLIDLTNFVLKGTCWTRDNWTKKQSADDIRKELKEQNDNTK